MPSVLLVQDVEEQIAWLNVAALPFCLCTWLSLGLRWKLPAGMSRSGSRWLHRSGHIPYGCRKGFGTVRGCVSTQVPRMWFVMMGFWGLCFCYNFFIKILSQRGKSALLERKIKLHSTGAHLPWSCPSAQCCPRCLACGFCILAVQAGCRKMNETDGACSRELWVMVPYTQTLESDRMNETQLSDH